LHAASTKKSVTVKIFAVRRQSDAVDAAFDMLRDKQRIALPVDGDANPKLSMGSTLPHSQLFQTACRFEEEACHFGKPQ